ncbi:undecaprenyldiphospho-muramoylpentapeptide beta-N-acetylglucosaminyltransferase [Adlercreutzia murintestinalis]|uniref:undecaprenyldiphospho-muramoylpentapeptide beta-N-acetylglucosaminyltransferase n=1 Tax=Adlercreutzia murintestinalis TaxID=2941325 RepID=UPI00203F022D|nr:undecaprenyldiphospho-muramoylpentapeptide beta-N-acetylglucosaminyltransferase [Adlercreutzia murintestinalis]
MGTTVVLSGGGTAGHINPALALAEVLRTRGCDVYFAGTPEGIEARLAPAAGLPYEAFEASGFDRSHPATLVRGVRKIAKSTKRAKAWFDRIKPDVVVGFGGYVCIPVSRAAEQLGIPVVLHEQNSVMGMANRYLAKRAAAVCLTYADTAGNDAPAQRTHVTGNPVRAAVTTATRAQGLALYGIPDDARVLLVFGGSLGARHINQAIVRMKDELLARDDLHVVQITGSRELESAQKELALSDGQAARWHVLGYQDRMPETLACADAIVSRAGATSLAEIAARCIPAILVPYPFATGDHQTHNAAEYVAAGAATMIPDADLDAPVFSRAVLDLVDDAAAREAMRTAAQALDAADAASLLADIVLDAA